MRFSRYSYFELPTRINHGKMLLKIGNGDEAFHVLSQAAEEIEAKDPSEADRSENLMHLGTISMLLGQAEFQADLTPPRSSSP